MSNKKQTGNKGEDIACDYLNKLGFNIMSRNWRYLKAEIDIICKDPETNELVFVEVKTRSSDEFGQPSEFVTIKQQKLIISAAHQFIVSNEREEEARFDIISIVLLPNGKPELEHIKDAFYATL
ncbi:MAG: putative endonuclease [Flavobacteriales bacterium]|jgi:putative endonuclease